MDTAYSFDEFMDIIRRLRVRMVVLGIESRHMKV